MTNKWVQGQSGAVYEARTLTADAEAVGEQMPLQLKGIEPIRYEAGMSNEEKFKLFHAANPHVLDYAISKALEMKQHGARGWSMRAIFHILRHDYLVQIDTTDSFRLNNNHSPYYSRMIMDVEPRLKGFFETRGDD